MFAATRDAIHAELHELIVQHAQRAYPFEACGLVVRIDGSLTYRQCRNISVSGRDSFQIHPEDLASAEDDGTLIAVVHSHPDDSAAPSVRDRVACHQTGLPWYIVAVPGGAWTCSEPEAEIPLVGRPFEHGVLDCYSEIRDYFRQVLAIELPDFARRDDWWKHGDDLYRKHFAEAGFVDAGDPDNTPLQLHDVVVMQVAADQANHAAVYVGGQRILHHYYGRLSGHDVWGGYWRRHAVLLLRHQSQLSAQP